VGEQQWTCPYCGQLVTMGKREQLKAALGHFETTAKPLALPGKANGAAPRPLPMGALSPGESRTATTYRERALADVWPPLAWAAISGGLVGVAGGFACAAFEWKWFVGVGIWCSATTIAWFVAGKDILDDDKLITSVQEVVRMPEQVMTATEPPRVDLTFNEKHKRGARIDRATLHAPATNAQGLAAYCRALVQGEAFPSLDGGRSGPGARSYGFSEPEFEQWRREAIRARLLESKGPQQGYDLTERGRVAFERIGRLELQEASYGL
jgi:hypothetical protein